MKNIVILTGIDIRTYLSDIDVDKNRISILIPKTEKLLDSEVRRAIKNEYRCHVSEVEYNEAELLDLITEINPDILFTIGWRRLISERLLSIAAMNINIHPAILPQYKGYHSEPFVIINGELFHGITAHLLETELDSGDIIMQRRIKINDFSTVASLKDELMKIVPAFFSQLLELLKNNTFNLQKQDHTLTKIIAPKRTPVDSEIDPNKSLLQLFNEIRACDPKDYPAYFYHKGEKVYIRISRDVPDELKENRFDI